MLASPDTLTELADVLSRPKLDPYLTHEEREEFFETLVSRVEIVEPTEPVRECRDPKDDKFLELTIEGGATAIVSGDRDLLVLDPFRGVSIVSSVAFLAERLRAGEPEETGEHEQAPGEPDGTKA